MAFSALSRLQDDPIRLKNYFLKGLSLVLGLTLPVTIACALFADDVVWAKVERSRRDRALAGSDGCDLGDNQSVRVADLFDWTGGTIFEDRSYDHGCGLRYGVACRMDPRESHSPTRP